MTEEERFSSRVTKEVKTQLGNQNVGYLLGAGSSYLDNEGYPLAFNIWDRIKDNIAEPQRSEIQNKLDKDGTMGLEHALDLLDPGNPEPTVHRTLVTTAIADVFSKIVPPLDNHLTFVRRIAQHNDDFVPIFSLNYDQLIELAADNSQLSVVDGFSGFYQAFFNQHNFDLVPSTYQNVPKGRVLRGSKGILHLYKLHGSLGWFSSSSKIYRCGSEKVQAIQDKRLMIPPQYRKAVETTTQPYSSLWTRFRAWLIHGPRPLNRLVCLGYGMRDEHVNDVLDSATSRSDFTLLIFAKTLAEEAFHLWSAKNNTIIVTEDRCSIFGQTGPGHSSLWDFKVICEEV